MQRIVRLPGVKEFSGLQRSTIYERVKKGDFPPPIKLSQRAVGWRLDDLERWLADRPRSTEPRP